MVTLLENDSNESLVQYANVIYTVNINSVCKPISLYNASLVYSVGIPL